MNPIRIALIDDQKLFRQSLATLMVNTPGLELVTEAENGRDFLARLQSLPEPPHVVLMDMQMPEMDGIELNAVLHRQFPQIRIIVLSVHANERLIARMIEAGANGYLVKNCDKEELITAIQTVYKSGFYINNAVLKAIQDAALQKNKPLKNVNALAIELSAREKEVLELICREYSNAEIAEKLFISVRTAEGHRNNLLAKTGCRNTAGLVLFAVKHHLFDTSF
ncbi:MAG: response regulator transcription factor [Chitinophagaceae bacterium]